MRIHPPGTIRSITLFSCLAMAWLTSGAAVAAEQKGCAVIDLGTVVQRSKASQAAQQRLSEEFAAQDADRKQQQQKLDDLDQALNAANQGGNAQAQQAAAGALMEAQARYADTKAAYERAASRRKMEELHKIVQQASAAYQAVGARQGYAKLFQKGKPDPIFEPSSAMRDLACPDKVDVSDEVVRQLDEMNGL